METTKNRPQDPHIDYKWDTVHQQNRIDMKPVIAFAPLEVDGLMINVWLRDEKSVSKIETNCIHENTRFFPHKLILSLGQIAFIDGDVIHGGGITPSGKRCHMYMCSPDVYAEKKTLTLTLIQIQHIPIICYILM